MACSSGAQSARLISERSPVRDWPSQYLSEGLWMPPQPSPLSSRGCTARDLEASTVTALRLGSSIWVEHPLHTGTAAGSNPAPGSNIRVEPAEVPQAYMLKWRSWQRIALVRQRSRVQAPLSAISIFGSKHCKLGVDPLFSLEKVGSSFSQTALSSEVRALRLHRSGRRFKSGRADISLRV